MIDLNHKTILVTGGTGSFGKAFIQYVLDKWPDIKEIRVFSRDEQKQYEMMREVSPDQYPIKFYLGDVRNFTRVLEVSHGVDIVVHSAAMKHVPMAELNPYEAIETNLNGSQNVIQASMQNGVGKVVALSTDKAALPINAYGASKLLLEKLFVAAQRSPANKNTLFSVVRYANVFGSKGSVIPLFLKLRASGELPITDPNMSRFSIDMQQSIDLVLFNIAHAQGGELTVPKAPSYTIESIANAVCEQCDKKVIGARDAEKMHEVMMTAEESVRAKELKAYYVIFTNQQTRSISLIEGEAITSPFEYSSGENQDWLTIEEIRTKINQL